MSHNHEYDTIERHAVSAEARENGMAAAESRKCKGCGHVAIFVQCHDNWLPLFDDTETSEKDILLA